MGCIRGTFDSSSAHAWRVHAKEEHSLGAEDSSLWGQQFPFAIARTQKNVQTRSYCIDFFRAWVKKRRMCIEPTHISRFFDHRRQSGRLFEAVAHTTSSAQLRFEPPTSVLVHRVRPEVEKHRMCVDSIHIGRFDVRAN